MFPMIITSFTCLNSSLVSMTKIQSCSFLPSVVFIIKVYLHENLYQFTMIKKRSNHKIRTLLTIIQKVKKGCWVIEDEKQIDHSKYRLIY